MQITTLKISGQDNKTFLQGLVTCDVNSVDNEPRLTACCNQKGRVIANFWLQYEADTFFLTLPYIMSTMLENHLKKYIFRSDVKIENLDKTLALAESKPVLWILPETSEQFTPQMLNLEKNEGVSFNKGCYLGQEIIARTQHLGQLKRHLYQFSTDETSTGKVGDEITDQQDKRLGIVLSIDSHQGYAVIEDRGVEEALLLNGAPLHSVKRV